MLSQLLKLAAADNLTIAIASERLRGARLMSGRMSSEFRPVLGAHGTPVSNPDNSASFFQAGFDATWELGLFGRSRSNRTLARGDVALASADLRAARVVVRAEVTRSYIGLRSEQERHRALQDAIQLAQRLQYLLMRRMALGLGTRQPLDQATELLLGLQSAQSRSEETVSRHAEELALLLGLTMPDSNWLRSEATPSVNIIDQHSVEETPADVLRSRPDVLRAEQQMLIAAAQLDRAQSELYPSVSIVGSLSAAFRSVGHLRRTPGNLLSIGPIIDLPLFDWSMRRAARDAHGSDLRATSLAYRQAVLEGLADAESALATLNSTGQNLHNEQQLLDRRASVAQAAERSQQRQLAGEIEILDARLAVLEATRRVSEAREQQCYAYIALRKALGDTLEIPESGAG